MTTIIGRFDATRIKDIAKEVSRRAKARKDYVVRRDKLGAINADGALHLRIADQPDLFAMRRGSLAQMAVSLDVPLRYLDRLTDNGHGDLAALTLTELLQKESTTTLRGAAVQRKHLVRTLDGEVDAFLSDSYRAFSNEDALAVALQEVKAMGAEVWDLRLTRDEFRLLAVAPGISGKVTLDRTFDPGDGWQSRWYGKEGDVLNAAFTLSNSETGGRKLRADASILRRVCENFCVWGDGVARVHVGKKMEEGEVFFSDDTRRAEDEVVWKKIRDVIRGVFTPEVFAEKLAIINATTQRVIDAPAVEVVDATVRAYGLPAEYKEALLEELIGSGDKTQYGLSNAVTAMVNPRNAGEADDEVRSKFEDVGGAILGLDDKGFKRLLAEAVA